MRAVAGLPRKGKYPVSSVRQKLNILSVEEVCQSLIYLEAWKLKPVIEEQERNSITTRAKLRGDIKLPKKIGWSGKKFKTKKMEAWNALPQDIRNESKVEKPKSSLVI